MEKFRSNVRRRVLTECGCMDGLKQELSENEVENLDIEIMKLANKVMSSEDGKFFAFQLAYICKPTWEEVDRIYNKYFGDEDGDELELKMIKRYAREGKQKVIDKSSNLDFTFRLSKVS